MQSNEKLPVIIHPTSLVFLADDPCTHQQNITLYNPYDFTIKYKVLSTNREKYKVLDSEGILKSRCSIDIVFRHKDITPLNEGIYDRFRIQICEHGKRSVIGKKDFQAVLMATSDTKQASSPPDEDFKALPPIPSAANRNVTSDNMTSSPSWWVMVVVLVCGVVLWMPLDNEESILPPILRVTTHQKYICAYVLGLISMKLIQAS